MHSATFTEREIFFQLTVGINSKNEKPSSFL
jgi:hypothetical protein